jgi:hypothetical protein
LGLDHGFGEGPPLIFETMIFDDGDKDDPGYDPLGLDQWQDRYSTEEAATREHLRVVLAVAKGEQP